MIDSLNFCSKLANIEYTYDPSVLGDWTREVKSSNPAWAALQFSEGLYQHLENICKDRMLLSAKGPSLIPRTAKETKKAKTKQKYNSNILLDLVVYLVFDKLALLEFQSVSFEASWDLSRVLIWSQVTDSETMRPPDSPRLCLPYLFLFLPIFSWESMSLFGCFCFVLFLVCFFFIRFYYISSHQRK